MHILQRAVLLGRTLCSGWPGNSSITVAEDQMGSLIQSGMIKQEGKQTKVSKIRMYVYIYRYIMLIHMYIHMHTLEALKWECAVFKVEKRNVSKCFPDYYWGSSKISFYYFSCFFFHLKWYNICHQDGSLRKSTFHASLMIWVWFWKPCVRQGKVMHICNTNIPPARRKMERRQSPGSHWAS